MNTQKFLIAAALVLAVTSANATSSISVGAGSGVHKPILSPVPVQADLGRPDLRTAGSFGQPIDCSWGSYYYYTAACGYFPLPKFRLPWG